MTPCIAYGQNYFKMFCLLGKHCIGKVVTYLLDFKKSSFSHLSMPSVELVHPASIPVTFASTLLAIWLIGPKSQWPHVIINKKSYICGHIPDWTQTTPTITHYHMKEPNTMKMSNVSQYIECNIKKKLKLVKLETTP